MVLREVYVKLDQVSARVDQVAASVNGLQGLSGRVDTAEEDIDALEEWTGAAELQLAEIQQRLDAPEDDGSGDRITELERQVGGEGGLADRADALEEGQRTLEDSLAQLSGAVQVAQDGAVTVGDPLVPLYLVGQVYINGVLFGEEETA